VRRAALALACALVLIGCSREKKPPEVSQDPGDQAARVANDTKVLGDAQQAVNAVVRNAPDCDAAKASMEEANRKIEEASAAVQTAAGRATLDAMRQQVLRVSQLCP
jgi:PBP1b-binding outer membrane lipoprotein LpoB